MKQKISSEPAVTPLCGADKPRECYLRNGKPKRQYSCKLAAELDLCDPLKHVYQCALGHWHIGRRQNLDHYHGPA